MNSRQLEVQKQYISDEKAVIEQLEECYSNALSDCTEKIRELNARTDLQNLQSIIYQKQYQEAIKKQLEGILDMLHTESFETISEYLTVCYEDGYIATLYDLQGQGIPLILPIDQNQVTKAIQTDSQLSKPYYDRLGEDVSKIKKDVKAQVSRGIANGSTWLEVADIIASEMTSPIRTAKNNAMRIARTEGGRVQSQAQLDVMREAVKHGADIVKQWDATLDGLTRPEHAKADGQIREMDEDFDVWGEKLEAPRIGGSARNVVNCRCCLLQQARWALDGDETKHLGRTDEMTDAQLEPIAQKLGISVDELRRYSGQIIPVSAKNYEDFRRKYESIWHYKAVPRNAVESTEDFDIIKNINTANGIKVSAPSQHMLERAKERGVSPQQIKSALEEPLHIGEVKEDSQGRKSQRFTGGSATVNVNPDTGIVTTIWKTGQKTRLKYGRGDEVG